MSDTLVSTAARTLDPWHLGMTPPASVRFETSELGLSVDNDPAPEAEAGAAEPELTPGAVADAPGEATPAPASQAPEIDWNDLDTLRTAYQVLQQHGILNPAAAEQQQVPELQAPDPFADDYQQQLEAWYEAKQAQALAPVAEFMQAQQQAQTEHAISGLLQGVAAEFKLGNVDAGRLRAVADSFAPEAASRFPFNGPQAAQYAARKAAEWLSTERKSAGESAVTAYKQSIGEIADTPAEPGVSGGGLTMEPRPKTYDEIIAKHIGRLG